MHKMYTFEAQSRNGGRPANITRGQSTINVEQFVSRPGDYHGVPQFALVRFDKKWDGGEMKRGASLYAYVSADRIRSTLRELMY